MQDNLFESTRTVVTSPTVFALTKISAKNACELNARWHSRFPYIHWSNVVRNSHYVCFTADYEALPYAVGIWSSPVAANRLKNGKNILELRRLAICPQAPKNTATWMIAQMVKEIKSTFPNIVKVISYQDTEVHLGTIYKAANWTPVSQSQLDWTTATRKRNPVQSSAPKIRWEFVIRKDGEQG